MTDADEPRFSDAEAREILRRATRTEVHPALPRSGPEAGVSLTELQEAARQAGIDPVAVHHASLARLPTPARSLATVLRGGPSLREHRVELPGHLPPERHPGLADALGRIFGADGTLDRDPGLHAGTPSSTEATATEASGRPGLFHWSEDHTQGRTSVTVEAGRDGASTVTVRADRRGWAAALNLVGLAAGFGLGALAILPATGSALAAVAGSLAVWWTVVHGVWRGRARRTADRLESAVVAVAAHLDPGSRG